MKPSLDRRGALGAGLALGLSLVVPTARACEFFSSGFTVVHPWTRATADDATSAIVCMTISDVHEADRLIGVETPVATGAVMVGDQGARAVDWVIPQGGTVVLGESGVHLRLVGLKHALPMGREYAMTLVFEQAGRLSATLSVDYARFG